MTNYYGFTFTTEELGMEGFKLDTEEVMKEFPDKVEAKCGACGASFEYHRHQGLSCPMCAADFKEVYFSSGKRIAFFEGERVQ